MNALPPVVFTRLPLVACAVFGVILIGRWWDRLSKQEQAAVLQHEIAHIRCGHVWERLWWLFSGQWRGMANRCREQEFQADQLVALHGHGRGMIRALSRNKNAPQSTFSPSHADRIDRLNRLIS